jgi:YesN/AraC family two-component response regulator
MGYHTITAASGADALAVAEAYDGEIDLLLTDVVMPHMNGAQLAAELVGRRPDIRIVYVSGYTENTASHLGVLDAGVDFLAKPFTREALALTLRRSFGRPLPKRDPFSGN